MAATLWGGDTAAASGCSAAALWGFPDFPRGPVEISHRAARQSRPGVVVRRVELDPRDVGHVAGIPATTAARTLSDVAGIVSGERFDAAFHYCLHERLATLEALHELAERRSGPGFSGATQFQDALDSYRTGPAAASPLEARLARRLRRSSLPRSVRQHPVQVDGRRRYLDFAWPDHMVAVEVDGFRWHSSRIAWRRDRHRLASLRRAGWTIVQVSQEDVDAGFAALVAELRNLLR
ncbi:MAG TPA: DUF559 domain-containing protein [Actinomycetota bacterium]|nr:DUF559 domain-containing protein [Actinomycetota bacterium]